jgi:hypothetical protein
MQKFGLLSASIIYAGTAALTLWSLTAGSDIFDGNPNGELTARRTPASVVTPVTSLTSQSSANPTLNASSKPENHDSNDQSISQI